MKTETMGDSTFLELAQEDDTLAYLLYSNMEVLHTRIYFLKIVELMIVGCEQCLCTFAILMHILHDRPCDGHTVVCRCASSDLVKKHQRARRKIVKDHGRLEHLHHESRFSAGDIVRRTHAGEYLVAIADRRSRSRHETTHLRHQHDQRCLSQEGRLTRHVRTGKDDHLLGIIVKIDVVRNELLARLHHRLDDRMTSLPDIDYLAVVHLRTAISV